MPVELIEKIKSVASFSEEEIAFFLRDLEPYRIRKGEHFLTEGQVCRHLGYVKSGLVMYYRLHDGMEVPTAFAAEKEWVSNLNSFTNKTASDLGIKALEDTTILRLSAANFESLCKLQPGFMKLKDYYTELYFDDQNKHAANLTMLRAKQRYYKFVEENADLVNRIPQYHIAAYLGIKPQSLSRIRK